MIAVAAHDIADIAIHALRKFGRIIPELPAGRIDDHEQAQLVAGIHKGRVLRTVGVTDNLHPGLLQLLGIPPMDAVSDRVSDDSKILVAVRTDQRLFIRFAVQVKAVFSLKLNAADSDAATITVDHISVFIEHPHQQVVQSRRRRRPEHRLLDRHPVGNGSSLPRLHLDLVTQAGDFHAVRL